MKIIYKQNSKIAKIIPKRKCINGVKYKKTEYLTAVKYKDGYALFNTLTCELLYLSQHEYDLFISYSLDFDSFKFMVEHNFYIPLDLDEQTLANQIFSIIENLEKKYIKQKMFFFVILTTTGCNARCFYCFEKGAKVSTMTPQTAEDVADFVIKNAAKKITIQWFGGEPLVNTKPIDIISQRLKDANIEYKSTMVSNGYLFDTATIKKAKELWKLDRIQITLDGTEEVYNKVKNYVYKNNNSPFKRVLNNIELLLKSGIKVSIRLNIDKHNTEDLFNLSRLLVEKFNKYDNCHIYPSRIFGCKNCDQVNETIERHAIIEKVIELRNYFSENMPTPKIEKLPKEKRLPVCMACSDNATMIVPDGHLGKCEHFVDSDFYGSIYSDDYDVDKIIRYKEKAIVSEECKKCKYYVQCMHLKCCSGARTQCDDVEIRTLENDLSTKITTICDTYFIENENKEEKNE